MFRNLSRVNIFLVCCFVGEERFRVITHTYLHHEAKGIQLQVERNGSQERKVFYSCFRSLIEVLVPVDCLGQVGDNFVHWQPNLFGRITISNRHTCIIFDRFEVNCDAKGHTDLVSSSVPPTDCARRIPRNVPSLLQLLVQVPSHAYERFLVLEQRQHRNFDWGNTGMELQKVALFATNFIFSIGRANNG